MSKVEKKLKKLRETIRAASEKDWKSYLDGVRKRRLDNQLAGKFAEDEGAYVLLDKVDMTSQLATEPLILHSEGVGDIKTLIAKNATWNSIANQASAVQLKLGLRRQMTWDIVGQVVGYHPANPWIGLATSTVVISLRAARIPEQMVVFMHPEKGALVPSYDEVEKALEDLHSGHDKKKPCETPEALLDRLVESLELHYLDLFSSLWTKPNDERALARRFEQFARALQESDGSLKISHYARGSGPEELKGDGQLKAYVIRTTNGKESVKPLTLARVGKYYFLDRGTI